MNGPPRKSGDPPDSGDATRQTALPRSSSSPDDQATGAVSDLGAVAELRAAMATPGSGDKRTLPLYAMPDQIVIGRGTACDWQLDDTSLSRKHAQVRWNGRELSIEDLGSANGTRVNGRPARSPMPVQPGDTVQLGTVIITFELLHPPIAAPDNQATRIVQAPEPRPDELTSSPGLPALHAAETVVRAAPERPPAGRPQERAARPGQAAVFRPERDAARPDEPTRAWDPRAALVRAPEKAFDGEFIEQLKRAWREKRRLFVLAGAAAWMAILLIVWAAFTKPPVDDDALAAAPQRATQPAMKVTPLDLGAAPALATAPPTNPVFGPSPDDRDAELAGAVAAYDQGHLPDALALFRRLVASDPKDESAKFMVELIESRVAQSAPVAP